MTEATSAFFQRMLALFPEARDQYEQLEAAYGTVLETIALEDVFFPHILELLQREADVPRLREVFRFFEDVSNSDDPHVLNIFSITILECLGNDQSVLRTATKYMGTKTRLLQAEADKSLGRPMRS